MADRVIFQVFEADIERLVFVEPQSERSGDTVLFVDDVGTTVLEIKAEWSNEETKKAKSRRKG